MNQQRCKEEVIKLTSLLLHKHYGENDLESLFAMMDDRLIWVGPGEDEYAVGKENIMEIFRQFAGMVPKCNLTEEEYDVMEIAPETYLCTGRVWITTDPSTNIFLQVHQRISMIYRWTEEGPRCCHMHCSNPYMEMVEGDVGFPTKMAVQSYQYLMQCVEEQKQHIIEQAALLERMSFKDVMTDTYNRNKFQYVMDYYSSENKKSLGVAHFDINGLKKVNDSQGHHAGDDLIRRTAKHILEIFPEKTFRLGGDEFVVVDEEMDEDTFIANVKGVKEHMELDNISCSIGICWRDTACDMEEQLKESDRLMYQDKAQFYQRGSNDRRGNRDRRRT